MRPVSFLLILAGLSACRADVQRTAQGQPGQPADSALVRRGDTVESANVGVELEAPRLIPGLRAQLSALSDSGPGPTPGNLAAYRQLAADLVLAMETDLNRVGSPEAEPLSQLGDSALHIIGGGAGEAPEPSREEVSRSLAMMEQAITRYQEAMRAANP